MTHQFGLDDLAWIALGVALFAAAPFIMPAWRWFTARLHVSVLHGRSVNHSQAVMSRDMDDLSADEQTDEADRPSVSEDNLEVPRLQLDKTKAALIEVLVYNGWQVADIRSIVKGDNGALGVEIEAARKRLGVSPPERTLRVRDASGARIIQF